MAMFDWPEANHTSPTSTPLIRRMFSPVTFSSPVTVVSLMASNRTRQRPSSPATVRLVWPANSTVTFSPGLAVPHTGATAPRCSTM